MIKTLGLPLDIEMILGRKIDLRWKLSPSSWSKGRVNDMQDSYFYILAVDFICNDKTGYKSVLSEDFSPSDVFKSRSRLVHVRFYLPRVKYTMCLT